MAHLAAHKAELGFVLSLDLKCATCWSPTAPSLADVITSAPLPAKDTEMDSRSPPKLEESDQARRTLSKVMLSLELSRRSKGRV